MATFTFRFADTEDALPLAEIYQHAGLPGAPATEAEFELMAQTGHGFLIAEAGGEIYGAVRFHEEEGIGWLDLLVSERPWAGAELVRAGGRLCQDLGIRYVRARCFDGHLLPEYFSRLGFLPIGRGLDAEGKPELMLERRLPLLTVREQRRADAAAIGEVAGHDPWVFEQGSLPGWFVAADGERIVGVIQCADARGGIARITEPILEPEYAGRGIELWMVDRASTYAETNGFHTAEMEASPTLEAHRKGLEDRYWVKEGSAWKRIFFTPKTEEDDWD